jgi:hypothetical protein
MSEPLPRGVQIGICFGLDSIRATLPDSYQKGEFAFGFTVPVSEFVSEFLTLSFHKLEITISSCEKF